MQGVVVTIVSLTIQEDFLPLELSNLNLILSMQLLSTLGVTTMDWKTFTLTIGSDDSKVIIKGDPTLTKTEVILKHLRKQWEDQDQGFLVEL